jgi:hypothetical protein
MERIGRLRKPEYLNSLLTVGGLQRSFLFKPLAILLAILLAPAFSWLRGGGGDGRARPFEADAQTTLPCLYTNNCILATQANLFGNRISLDLIQLESDAVNLYLSTHLLPPSEASDIYQYGRQDLRDAVRAAIYTILVGIIQKPASLRTTHEQTLFNWFQGIVQNDEIALYQQAIAQYNSFQGDPCDFTLDPAIAQAYKISYDGTPFCFGGLQSSIFGPSVPAESYFLAYGLRHSYGAKADTDPNFASLIADSAVSAGEIAGIALGAGTVVAAAIAPAIYVNLTASVAAGAIGTGDSLFLVSSTTVTSLGIGGAVAAPVAIVLFAVAVGVVAGLEVFENQQTINELNGLNNTLAQVTSTPPDLSAFLSDSTGLGTYKLEAALYSLTSPDTPSATALPLHQATDHSFSITPQSTGLPLISNTLQYRDWQGNQWSAQTSGGWFVQNCIQGPTSQNTCQETTSFTADLRYVDWSGTNWTASRLGSTFVSTKASPAATDTACPADSVTGVSNVANPSTCVTYTSTSIPMQDANGNPITVSMSTKQPPAFVSPGTLSFSLGTATTLNITATGNPAPTITWNAGLTGDGFTFPTSAVSSFPLTFGGSLTAPTGTYTLTLTASNSLGSVQQNFPVTLADVLQIISPNTINVTAGQPFHFTVAATGDPIPKLSLQNIGIYSDLSGPTFQDNGDGTGTFSATYTGVFSQESCLIGVCPEFVATNSQGTATQFFTINVAFAPQASFAPGSTMFTAGVPNQVLLSSYGATTPVSWIYDSVSNAPWLSLKDNGDGTAWLSGTPPANTTGVFTPGIAPNTQWSGITVIQNFPVTVTDTPVFTSSSTATFTVGALETFQITTTSGSASTNDTLPQGLTFIPGSPSAIAGTPAVGTGGQYTVRLNVSDASGSATQDLVLNVDEQPAITSPPLAVLFAGVPASVNVTTSGYPNVSTHPVSVTAGPPASPSLGDGMYFGSTGLPASLQASNLNPAGEATGTLAISGTPQTGDVGLHKVQIKASNAVGNPASQTLLLYVFPYSPAAPVDLTAESALARDSAKDVIATVVVANGGSAAAQNVALTAVKLGGVLGTVSPVAVASIGAASTAAFKVLFPAASVGASGSPSFLSISGSYTGGTFNSAARVVLP